MPRAARRTGKSLTERLVLCHRIAHLGIDDRKAKTDRVDDEEELLGRYAPQLRLYRRALEEITGVPVAEAYLCHLRTGRAIAGERE